MWAGRDWAEKHLGGQDQPGPGFSCMTLALPPYPASLSRLDPHLLPPMNLGSPDITTPRAKLLRRAKGQNLATRHLLWCLQVHHLTPAPEPLAGWLGTP